MNGARKPRALLYNSRIAARFGVSVAAICLVTCPGWAQLASAVPPVPIDVAAPSAGAQKTPSGVVMRILVRGSGSEHPRDNDCVKASFTGWKRDGTLFSTSTVPDQIQCMPNIISGVAAALKRMVTGEKRRVWVPADQLRVPGKPARDKALPQVDLTYDVELIEIIKAPQTPLDLKIPPQDAFKTSSGLAFKVLKKGSGNDHPSPQSDVTLHFSGWTSNGKLFQSTVMAGHPAIFHVGSASPPGWREALPHMVVGEKTRFWIPAALAFGARPASKKVPAGDLVYDIELISMQ